MGLWLLASFPALILVLSFIRFSFVLERWIPSGHELTFWQRYVPQGGLTNGGVMVGSEPAGLDFGFELHTILLCVRTFGTFGAWPHFAGSAHAPVGSANDGVVVRVGTSSLDSSLQFHRILLSSQQPHEILAPGVAIMSDQKLVLTRAASALGQPPAELQLSPTRRSRKSHDRASRTGLRRNPAGGQGRGCGSNRDVVVGSDLACADLSLELHTVLLLVFP
jgi:hypothetical protein